MCVSVFVCVCVATFENLFYVYPLYTYMYILQMYVSYICIYIDGWIDRKIDRYYIYIYISCRLHLPSVSEASREGDARNAPGFRV
jgi:hypothetical protein